MKKPRVLLPTMMLLMTASTAQADLPFMKGLAAGQDLPRPIGITAEIYTMTQDLDVDRLEIDVQGLPPLDNSGSIEVESDIDLLGSIRLDAWLLPFVNVFASLGSLEGTTSVDFGFLSLPAGFPELGKLDFDYDGLSYTFGFTTAYVRDTWFAAATLAHTDNDLDTDGDIESSVSTLTIQSRAGLRFPKAMVYTGINYQDSQEEHSGLVSLPIPLTQPIPVDVEFSNSDRVNLMVGGSIELTERLQAGVEVGFADREHLLANLTWRF